MRINESIKTSGMASLMGVTPLTIRRWVKTDSIQYHRSPKGHLYFTPEDIQTNLNEEPNTQPNQPQTWAYYTRSSSGSTTALQNQYNELKNNYPEPTHIIKDSGSGLNEHRKGLNKLIKLARNNEITDIAITYQDRLTRFGYTYLKEFFQDHDITIHILHERIGGSPHEELIQDFMSLLASFSGRFYKLKSHQNERKVLQLASQELENREGSE